VTDLYARPEDYSPEPCFFCGGQYDVVMAPVETDQGVMGYRLVKRECRERCFARDPEGWNKARAEQIARGEGL
jgi:hypothetical protein